MHWCSLLLDGILGVKSLLSLALDLLSALLLVVLAFHILELTGESLNLVFVLVDLSLVHIKFGSHGLHLASLFLKVLLIDRELFSDLRAWLAGKEILQLDVELLLFLDDDILLHNLFSLLDQTLLQGLYLLEHLPGIRVSALELSPSVVVKWIFEFLRQSLDLKSLSKKLLLQVIDLLSEVSDLSRLRLDNAQLALEISDLELKKTDVLEALLVLDFSLGEG